MDPFSITDYPVSYDGNCPVCGIHDREVWDNSNPRNMKYQCRGPYCHTVFIDRSPVELPVQPKPDAAADSDKEGVWVIADRDHFDYISRVFPDEISALRALNGRGYGRVAFIEYGKELS